MTDNKTVLIIEYDDDIVELLTIHVKDLGCKVMSATNGQKGLAIAKEEHFDLIILDLMLPGLNGLEICRKIRQTDRYTPIMILTAKSEEIDKVMGLETGADDYLTKPFSIREFIARVKVIFRRNEDNASLNDAVATSSVVKFSGLEIDMDKRKVTLNNIRVELSPRKFVALSILVFLSALAHIHLAVTSANGDVIGGWSIEPTQLRIGLTRLIYPFFAGLLLYCAGKLTYIKQAFLLSSLLIIIVLAIPRIGGSEHVWMNGLYNTLTIIFIFPLIIFIGASGDVKGKYASRVCKFLRDISYPLYMTHYPLIIYTGWVSDHKANVQLGLGYALVTFVASLVIAWAGLKLYDEPVRQWLKKKILLQGN